MNDIERKYLKIWGVVVVILTILYLCFCDTGMSINQFSDEQRTYVRQLIPRHMNQQFPQPFINFSEPVDVWSNVSTN